MAPPSPASRKRGNSWTEEGLKAAINAVQRGQLTQRAASLRKPQIMNSERALKLNKPIVEHHFQSVKKLYDELDILQHHERLYNMDEKGCRITVHHQQTVLAEKGSKRVHLIAPEDAEKKKHFPHQFCQKFHAQQVNSPYKNFSAISEVTVSDFVTANCHLVEYSSSSESSDDRPPSRSILPPSGSVTDVHGYSSSEEDNGNHYFIDKGDITPKKQTINTFQNIDQTNSDDSICSVEDEDNVPLSTFKKF
ncbi:unnamed protein product [Leptosia nina]|uniref:Uncharacterized protein n=1 Tax=Leptosia nina TaxID=320188 RepID=A0AAV1JZP8_9NEOP